MPARRRGPWSVDVPLPVADASRNGRGAQVTDHVYELAMKSPVGWLGVRTDGAAVTAVDILADRPATAGRPGSAGRRTEQALTRYFVGDAAALATLPVAPAGTPFQRRVWERMSAIPAGEVLSYGALAGELGTSARAVGGACRANPIPIVIPCHRVVAAHGLGGYSGERGGDWLAKKRWLLAHEGARP